jgi:DNA-3-methyladenine glycosylase I
LLVLVLEPYTFGTPAYHVLYDLGGIEMITRCAWATTTDPLYIAYHEQAFDDFDPSRVAQYGPDKVAELLANPGIVRNRLKVAAAIQNACSFLEVQKEFGSFNAYIWGFVGGTTRQNGWVSLQEIPGHTPESDAMSRDLLKRGFKFVGSTICYAFMQAVGLVNDHTVDCFRYTELR